MSMTSSRPEEMLAAITISVEAVAGQPGQVLCAAAGDADLLVVGRSGHGSVTESLLGSVGLHCVLHARSPVTVVGAGSAPIPDGNS